MPSELARWIGASKAVSCHDFNGNRHETVAPDSLSPRLGWRSLALALILTALVYWPGLCGGWLFDDYPNIVDNRGVQPTSVSLPTLITAALSSPASDFKRPLASLSFAANYLASDLDPFWMKLTNLVIHLMNGVLVFLLSRELLRSCGPQTTDMARGRLAATIAAGWLLLPINLTAVLYVVQRMESMANLFVLLGLLGYVVGRLRMRRGLKDWLATPLCVASLLLATAIGTMAKETAVMLPLYAFLTEWIVFDFRTAPEEKRDGRLLAIFLCLLVLPIIAGLAWLTPMLIRPESWATRNFTLGTRLLTEMRVVVDYFAWTILPLPHSLSFYHDDYVISTGLLSPLSTLASLCGLIALVALVPWLRRRSPLVSLGMALFLGGQLLTATVLPLELVYEHRNYFASFGLVLALATLIFLPQVASDSQAIGSASNWGWAGRTSARNVAQLVFGTLMLWWLTCTALTAYAWGDPLRLAQELALRDPGSPRAQYELGRTYIIYSEYDPQSPFTKLAYAPLEKAASIPDSSILPLQALIFMNSRMHLPLKPQWWEAMIAKLNAHKPGVQDESSLGALSQCARGGQCDLPRDEMVRAYQAALSHPAPSARLQSMYGDYAWNVLGDRELGLRMTRQASETAPRESAYLVTLIRMEIATGRRDAAEEDIKRLRDLNIGGSLDSSIKQLSDQLTGGEHDS